MDLILLPISQGDGVEQIADENCLFPIFVRLVEANESIGRCPSLGLRHIGQIAYILLHPLVDFIVEFLVFDSVLDERSLRLHLILDIHLHLLAIVLELLLGLVVLEQLVVPYLLPGLSSAHEVLAMVERTLCVMDLLKLDV